MDTEKKQNESIQSRKKRGLAPIIFFLLKETLLWFSIGLAEHGRRRVYTLPELVLYNPVTWLPPGYMWRVDYYASVCLIWAAFGLLVLRYVLMVYSSVLGVFDPEMEARGTLKTMCTGKRKKSGY
jgi:hypothetical protein